MNRHRIPFAGRVASNQAPRPADGPPPEEIPRLLEDGTPRLTEDNTPRILED